MVKKFIKERIGTIIIFVILVIFLIWGYFSIQSAREHAITFKDDYEAPDLTWDYTDPGTYKSVAKTDRLELFYNEAKGAIQVKDLESGYLWKGICDDDVYDLSTKSVNAFWRGYLQSSIVINYGNQKKRDTGTVQEFSGKDCGEIKAEYIANGVAVTYGFTSSGIYITIEYVLDGDEFVVRVPADGIVELSKYAVTSIELLPFMGASMNTVDGYLFYPDGSGAITTYEKANTRPADVKMANYYTFTNKSVTFQNLWNADDYYHYTVAMPVFGIKNGENALFATMEEGGENAGLIVYPSGYVVDLNHASFEIYTRNTYSVNSNNMSTAVGTNSTGGTLQRMDKQLIPEDKAVRYFFLNGDEADYSGMAGVYREYLLEKGMLRDAIADGEELPLALRLLMGTTKEGMIFDEYVSMTDFDQVQEIMERLDAKGINSMEVVLSAWMKGYDDYQNWGPARQLGGTGGLKTLNKYLESAAGKKVYLENVMLFATSNTDGISEKKDVAYDGLNMELSGTNYDGLSFYFMNPLAAYRRNEKLLDKMSKYEMLGVGYTDVGRYAYADFNEDAPFLKSETVNQLRELLGSTKSTGRNVATLGANQYVYSYSDYLFYLREENYGLVVSDASIPFVQMVVSGMIPYSTEGAGNLAYDLQIQKLKWIEYGAIPYFFLTYESALNLRDTGYDELFSSTFDDWENTVVETYTEFKENLSCVYGEQMVSHEILTDDLVRVEYGNGIAVYVNYGKQEASVDNVTVPAKDYVVVRGGEH